MSASRTHRKRWSPPAPAASAAVSSGKRLPPLLVLVLVLVLAAVEDEVGPGAADDGETEENPLAGVEGGL